VADSFSRNKMRWLNSVMYSGRLKAMACRVAYVIADRVNKVTGDCWLAHTTIARKLGVSTKTIQRSLRTLERTGFIVIRYADANPRKQRFVPSFILGSDDGKDEGGPSTGHNGSPTPDSGVHQSFYKNLHRSDLPGEAPNGRTDSAGQRPTNNFKQSNRGQLEVEIAKRLGPDGFDVLSQLAKVDDRIVLRLCEAQANNRLTTADLYAARLAARQIR
jgi:hypothetical protein